MRALLNRRGNLTWNPKHDNMKTPAAKLLGKWGLTDPEVTPEVRRGERNRRDFIKKAGLGGLTLGGLMFGSMEDTLAHSTSGVNRNSAPSDLKITDLRFAIVMNGHARCPIVRIDTNQGIYGLGEVRDGASWRYAMFLKSRILGMNPCSVEQVFKRIKQFGFHGRQGGGVCAIEMALWDLTGKAYNVPAYQLLGGKYRDKVRLYADTPEEEDPKVFVAKLKDRLEGKGFTFLKMDLGIEMIRKIPGTTATSTSWHVHRQCNMAPMTTSPPNNPSTPTPQPVNAPYTRPHSSLQVT